MKNGLTSALLALSLLVSITANTLAQSRTRQRHVPTVGERSLVFLETGIGVGIGKYNATGIATGLGGRFQMPLGSNFTLNAKTGFSMGTIKKAYRYGGYYDYYGYYYASEYPATYFWIPVNVGPRFYFAKNLHVGLNLGVDIGVSEVAATSFHFEPAFGYALPLANGNVIDFGTTFETSFEQGSSIFNFRFAYGLNLGK
ncbi:hypothetical protein J2I47_26015 [Fibrella sp. HMF5335]|uniref:Outer membrane protein beta-barrel domain-containing protein n=1 Tax=Fibrella rubiginis TaxID=2817060 RepID=A0A939K7J7_9BACT|nr:hypothetical protein [Fibrella rubiginis]MBO0940028.1 hypothetical protein [Fibrella rubiginis]